MDTLEFLLSKGADVNQTDGKGKTALMWACVGDLPAMVERLCQVPGINLNYRDDTLMKSPPLLFAVSVNQCVEKLGHTGIVETLLPVSNLSLTNTDGYPV